MPRTISANDARNWIDAVSNHDNEVVVEVDGKPKPVILSVSAFEESNKLLEERHRADGLVRLYAIRDERVRKGIVTQRPPEISPESRAEATRGLRALQKEVSARKCDLTKELIEEIANHFSRDVIDDMVAEGKIIFERNLPERGSDAHPC